MGQEVLSPLNSYFKRSAAAPPKQAGRDTIIVLFTEVKKSVDQGARFIVVRSIATIENVIK